MTHVTGRREVPGINPETKPRVHTGSTIGGAQLTQGIPMLGLISEVQCHSVRHSLCRPVWLFYFYFFFFNLFFFSSLFVGVKSSKKQNLK